MNKKIVAKQRRSRATRAKIARLGMIRMSVHRTAKHLYVQLIDPAGAVLACASTLEKTIMKECHNNGGNIAAAIIVGRFIGERAKKVKVTKVAFDRSGFKYHGRIKALADAARENGIQM